MAAIYPYRLPNGILVDLQNSSSEVDIYNNVKITLAGGKIVLQPCINTAAANALRNDIATSLGLTNIMLTSTLWSNDNSTWTPMPISIMACAGNTLHIQINGSSFPSFGKIDISNNTGLYIPSVGPDAGATSSQAQFYCGGTSNAVNGTIGNLILYDTTIAPIATYTGVISFTA